MATWKKLLQEGLDISGSSNSDVTNNYITVSDGTNSSPVYLGATDSLTFSGGGDISVTESSGTITISFTATAESNSFGSVVTDSGTATSENANDALTIAGSAGLKTTGSGQNVTISFAFGELTSSTALASGDIFVFGDASDTYNPKGNTLAGIAAFMAGSGLTASAGVLSVDNITLGTDTTGAYAATVTGTLNEIEVTGSGGSGGEGVTYTVGLPNDVTVSGNLTVGGDFNITGEINQTNVTELVVADKTIIVAKGASAAGNADGAGLVVDSSGLSTHGADAQLRFDETGATFSEWQMIKGQGASPNDYSWVAGMVQVATTAALINVDAGVGTLGMVGTSLYVQTAS